MEDAYARSVSEVLDFFGVDPTKGLSDSQVVHHSRLYGRNVLPEEKRTPFWKLVLKQFDDLLVKILIVAAIVSFVLALANGETGLTAFLEPFVILLILAANAAVGVITETNAEKALEVVIMLRFKQLYYQISVKSITFIYTGQYKIWFLSFP
jgi:Ca2+-transporting ATPase/Ca2+ transporting ATPase